MPKPALHDNYRQLNFRVPAELFDRLFTHQKQRELDEKRTVPQSSLVVEAIQEYLARRGA